MTGYEIIGVVVMSLIAAGIGYLMWEVTREARRS
jgi:hypothetical protein